MGNENNDELQVATSLIASAVSLNCPHCQKKQEGFLGDPRGETFPCDDCGQLYRVHKDADIEMY